MKQYSITVSKTILATPAAIWNTWCDEKQFALIHGYHSAQIDYRVGGMAKLLYHNNYDIGATLQYLEVEAEHKLVFCWKEAEKYATTLLLTSTENGTRVSITQECGTDAKWMNTCFDNWERVLDNIDNYLHKGTLEAIDEQHLGYKIITI